MLGRLQIAEAVDIRAVVCKEHCNNDHHQKNRRDDLLRCVGKSADKRDLGNKVLVPCGVDLLAKEHQQTRHEEEHCKQREENRLNEANAEVKAQPELHKEHRNEAADGRQAAAADLRHSLAQRDNDRFADRQLLMLLLIAVAENDRIVHRQR